MWIRRKAPQLIVAAIAILIVTYVTFEILEDASAIISFTQNVTSTVMLLGYWGILGLMLLESSSLPIPSEVVLPFAGYLVSTGALNFWVTVIVATAAGLTGSLIDYYIGLKGVHLLSEHKILGRALFSTRQLEIAAGWFKKYGVVMVFLGRLIPGFRTFVSFPAGAVKMSLVKFIAFTTAGCLVWNSILIYVGYYLGINWKEVAGISHYLIIAVAAAFIVVVVAYLIKRKKKTRFSK